jgi:hypothetical protein
MSGGSFNYLCHKSADDLMAYNGTADLEEMIADLEGLGYAEDAACALQEIQTIVNSQRARIDAKLKSLHGVMENLEWWRSCDRGEDQFKAALAEWRNS